jgi:predicted Holliday junction resolvase-like endonuclease
MILPFPLFTLYNALSKMSGNTSGSQKTAKQKLLELQQQLADAEAAARKEEEEIRKRQEEERKREEERKIQEDLKRIRESEIRVEAENKRRREIVEEMVSFGWL